jgi:tape measure domain-containing protein
MTKIDTRVVQIIFDNKDFLMNVAQTMLTLSNLNKKVDEVDVSAPTDQMGVMAKALEAIESRTSMVGVAFNAVWGSIAVKTVNNVTGAVRNLWGTIKSGGERRALNLEQARFQFKGLGMDVAEAEASALAAVKGTAFGLDEAARLAGVLGAAGMKTGDEMTRALRSVSGVAAMAGASYSDIGDIMADTFGKGRAYTMEFNRLSQRGINAWALFAKELGVSQAEVRDMAAKGAISAQQFADVLEKNFGEHATKANETYSGSLSNMRSALSRLGAVRAASKFEEHRKIFNALTPVIDSLNARLKPLIDTYNELYAVMGKRVVSFLEKLNANKDADGNGLKGLIPIVSNLERALKSIGDIIGPIARTLRLAFKDVFPNNFLGTLTTLTDSFANLVKNLKPSEEVLDKLRRVFSGIFAAFGIGWEVIKRVGQLFGAIAETVLPGLGGGFLDVLARFGDFLVKLHDSIKNGKEFSSVFDGLSETITVIFSSLGSAIGWLSGVLGKAFGAVASFFGEILSSLGGIDISEVFKVGVFAGLLVLLDRITRVSQDILSGKIFSGEGTFLSRLGIDPEKVKGYVDSIFQPLGDALGALQANLRAGSLLKIASAIAIITASVWVLSRIDTKKLIRALTALTVMFGLMGGMLAAIALIGKNLTGINTPLLTASLIPLAAAIFIMSLSVAMLAKISKNGLVRAMTAITLMVGIFLAFTYLMEKLDSEGIVKASVSIVLMAVALRIFASGISKFENISWNSIAKGVVAMGAMMALFTKFAEFNEDTDNVLKSAAALLIMAFAVEKMAKAIHLVGKMDIKEIAKGLGALALGVAGFIVALDNMPKHTLLKAASLMAVAIAVSVLAGAMKVLGGLSFEEMIIAVSALGLSLAILVVALNMMNGGLVGAAALFIAAVGINVLADALGNFAKLSWKQIGGALLKFVAAVAVIVVVSLLLVNVAAAVAIFGLSILVLGAGLFLVASAFVMFNTAVATAMAMGAAGMQYFADMIMAFVKLIPDIFVAIAKGIADFIDELGRLIPSLVDGIVKILVGLLDVIIKVAPKLGTAVSALIMMVLDVIRESAPDIIATGWFLLTKLLQGVEDNIGTVTDTAVGIVTNFISALTDNLPLIMETAANFVITFLNSLADTIRDKHDDLVSAYQNVALALVEGLTDGITKAGPFLWEVAKTIGRELLEGFKEAWGIKSPSKKMSEMGGRLIDGLIQGLKNPGGLFSTITDTGAKVLSKFKEKLSSKEGSSMAGQIMSGLKWGFQWVPKDLLTAAGNVGRSILSSMKWVLGIKSPSREGAAIGRYTTEGVALGLTQGTKDISDAAEDAAETSLTSFASTLSQMGDLINPYLDVNPVVKPTLDLSAVAQESGKLGAMLDLQKSFEMAADIANNYGVGKDDVERVVEVHNNVNYTQNNTSPKALEPIDIYRQTKNQLKAVYEDVKL